ncbi:hypothetical protein ACPPVO_18100 [Dactylosporangium sp. McL0621]|uniref:hypothetical protein n=1 Tax=Dactylosporangium sp. McL0621 TaxID=3415678 RepID=UPI003CEF9FC8
MTSRLPGVLACAALAAGWLVAVAGLTRAVLARVLESEGTAPDERLGSLEFLLAAVLIVGPLVVAGVARWLRLAKLPQIALVVAGVTLLPAIILSLVGTRQLGAPEPEPTGRQCVTFSGGTNTCPGG